MPKIISETLSDSEIRSILMEAFKTIPDLMSETAPDGYSNSIYHRIIHLTPEILYKEYKRKMAFERITDKYFCVPKEKRAQLKSFEEFMADLDPPKVDEMLEMRIVIYCKLMEMVGLGYLKKAGESTSYLIDERQEFLSPWLCNILGATETQVLKIKEKISRATILHQTNELENLPIFQHLFKALKACNMEWHYWNHSLEFFITLFRSCGIDPTPIDLYDPENALKFEQESKSENEDDLNEEVESGQSEDYTDSGKNTPVINITPQDIDDMFSKSQHEIPSDIVIAYFDIYQDWPQGYPPQRKDYY